MNDTTTRIKKPLRRSLMIGNLAFVLVLAIILGAVTYLTFSSMLYASYDARLADVITYVENKADADDLRQCVETGSHSSKYDELQEFLNGIVDDFSLEYLYICIPSADTMTNVVSATSEAEFAAGEDNMELLETSDAYSPQELELFRSFWNADDISFFQETSDYGTYYTACKPLRDSLGSTVALICADYSLEELYSVLRALILGSLALVVVMYGIFGVAMNAWLRKNVTDPLRQLEESGRAFASKSHDLSDMREVRYQVPDIRTQNEIQSLSETIGKLATDIREHANTNLRLAQEAESATKIAELSESIRSLLVNMPGLTFSKDVTNGRYLACNQAFAEYAHKDSPDGVVGLTDYEIFDPVTARHFVEDDEKALSMDEPYVFFEDVFDAAGNPRQFQTTKLKFTDTHGRTCTLGMCVDVSDMFRMQQETLRTKREYEQAISESMTYSHIARALSADYTSVYYVDLQSSHFIQYSNDSSHEELAIERRGADFFAYLRSQAPKRIYADDLPLFLESFDKESVLQSVAEHGSFSLTYRMVQRNVPAYMNIKATRMENDRRHIVVGVTNVDAAMRHQEAIERVRRERTAYARINALSGDYICIYAVDPETDHYVEFSASKAYNMLNLQKEGDDFFETIRTECPRTVYVEDRHRALTMLTKERVLDEVERNGMFTIDYRLMLEGKPNYVSLKATMVREKDGPQLIVGVVDIDTQVRRRREYEYNLAMARNKASLDALTGVKNKHAYVDIEAQLNHKIQEGQDVQFSVVVCDINELKEVNDLQGHQAGDRCIKDACMTICHIFKHSPVFRIGGDEFAVISQGHDYGIIDELVAQLAQYNRESKASGGITIACGLARFDADQSVATVFERADQRMYENKRALKRM